MRNDRLLRDDQGVVTRAKDRVHAGKHARAQLLLAVVNTAAHTHRAAIGLDQGVHRLNNGGEGAARQGVHRQLGLLASADLGLETFGQTEVEQHGIDVFHVDHVRAVFEVITHVDLFEAGDAVKRCQHLQALQRGLGQCQFGARDLQGRCALVQRSLADEVLRHQLLVALVVGLGNRQLGTGLRHLSLLQLVFELHHQLALAHTLAIAEKNLFNAPTNFRAQHHPLT